MDAERTRRELRAPKPPGVLLVEADNASIAPNWIEDLVFCSPRPVTPAAPAAASRLISNPLGRVPATASGLIPVLDRS